MVSSMELKMSNIVIYSKDHCPHCVQAKNLLTIRGKQFTEVKINQDITVEEFKTLFPDAKTVPIVMINGVQIGGYNELQEWVNDQGRTFLAEGMAS